MYEKLFAIDNYFKLNRLKNSKNFHCCPKRFIYFKFCCKYFHIRIIVYQFKTNSSPVPNDIVLRGEIQFISRALPPNPSPSGRGAGVRV